MKNNQFRTLMRKYSKTVIIAFTVFVLTIFIQTMISSEISTTARMDQMTRMVYDRFYNDYQLVTDISHKMMNKESKIYSYDKLFELSYAQFREEAILNTLESDIEYLPGQFENFIRLNPRIQRMVIEVDGYDVFYQVDKDNTKGIKVDTYPEPLSRYKIEKDLINTFNFTVIGKITFYLEDEEFRDVGALLDSSNKFNTYIVDGNNNLMYSSPNRGVYDEFINGPQSKGLFTEYLNSKNYHISQIRGSSDYRFITAIPQYQIFFNASNITYIWLVFAVMMVILLLVSFKYIFRNYSTQVDDVVDSLKLINVASLGERIDLNNKQGEFLLISDTINTMLDNTENYIDEIYTLELRQKEAELSALQAQINPHFMYNTLEYIRMNVLSEGLTDLSHVVYSFASLLRNNITSVKTIPLKNELDFCEKYVFLYQIRHPEHVAYSFNVSREVQHMIVPRFILQPIVENYLIHGLDYERIDNAISVDASKVDNEFVIKITDNGNGMKQDDLEALQFALRNHDSKYRKDSIGIMNVNDRLKYFYDGRARLTVDTNAQGGITVVIRIWEDKDEKINLR